ncbi:MAG TPA: DUF4845 domain-containing protein [Burkholderiales bacterium]
MRRKQSGVTFTGLIIGLILFIIVALIGMKLAPSYIEFRAAKKAIDAIAQEKQGGTPAEIRRAFEARAAIDDINTVKPTDLEITKESGQVVITFAYRKEVPLFTNVGLYIDYAATSGGQ